MLEHSANLKETIEYFMRIYPVKKLESGSKDHARHAIEQALVIGKISRGRYEELIGYVVQVMFKEVV